VEIMIWHNMGPS